MSPYELIVRKTQETSMYENEVLLEIGALGLVKHLKHSK